MKTKVLYITPPFTQLNTPYPATAYLKGFTNVLGVESFQLDAGIELILKAFSKSGLKEIFNLVSIEDIESLDRKLFLNQEKYIQHIDSLISFLQGNNNEFAQAIVNGVLPAGPRFDHVSDLEISFGDFGVLDKAKHLGTLVLEDLGDFISKYVDENFGFSRYAERLGRSASSFDPLEDYLKKELNVLESWNEEIIDEHLSTFNPDLVAISVPFPGNLVFAFRIAHFIKSKYSKIKIALGGGYPNTELREISDVRVFNYFDYITLDDGERPVEQLIRLLEGEIEASDLLRTFRLVDGKVVYTNNPLIKDLSFKEHATPCYTDLKLNQYISVVETGNPMHRLWSDGVWLKLTMAHGCYWKKCTFCDIHLDYIGNYQPLSASHLVDRVEELIKETGKRNFHFVDEAAPPALMRDFAIEIIKRDLSISWWTNIRFEKSFTSSLCKILAESGCIAVSGGLEVASDRLLKLIDKGVTIKQVAQVLRNFRESNILCHAYLMYGFPTQTEQEIVDSLEVVRQLFETGVLESAFWHQFAMTAHSPVGKDPESFQVEETGPTFKGFADNDRFHEDQTGIDHSIYSEGLRISLHNYMLGAGIEEHLSTWFEFDLPRTTLHPLMIEDFLMEEQKLKTSKHFLKNGSIYYDGEILRLYSFDEEIEVKGKKEILSWLNGFWNKTDKVFTLQEMEADFNKELPKLDWFKFESGYVFGQVKEMVVLGW